MNRILVISEATYLTTGYSKYCESLIKGLLQADIGIVAEMAMYAEVGDPRNGSMPWKIYPVIPHEKDPNRQIYDSDPQAAFGRHTFDAIVADFKPTHVITIQDFWYNNYIDFSPLRKTFNWIWMPTVDAINQNPEWLDAYSRVDALVTYTDFSKDVLEKEGNLFVHGEAPFAASETFHPMNKAECKKSWGINPESKIIGFVSRNQRRKLFGDLLYSFGQFIKRGQVNDTLLWLHTSYPDKSGFCLPRQIMENEICSKVLLTYYCQCGNIFPAHFSGAKGFCTRCQQWSANTANVGGFIPDSEMSRILNSLDLYVQYSNCFPGDQEVLTDNGFKEIKDIKIGDLVFTSKSGLQQVINKFERITNENLIEVNCYSEFYKTLSTKEHPYLCLRKEDFNKFKLKSARAYLAMYLRKNISVPDAKFINAEELKSGDLLLEKIDLSFININRIDLSEFTVDGDIINEDTIKIAHGNTYNRYINVNEEFLKFVGLFLADGHAHKNSRSLRITAENTDSECIDLAKSVLRTIGGKEPSIYKYANKKAVDVTIGSALFYRAFKKWFYDCNGDKIIPKWCEQISPKLQEQIIKGLFLGDGSIIKNRCGDNYTSTYSTTSRPLIGQILDILKRNFVTYGVSKSDRSNIGHKDIYRLEIFGNLLVDGLKSVKTHTKSMYYNGYHIKQIKFIKEIAYNGTIYNIEVKNDNTYQNRLGIVHNCEGLGMTQIQAAACGVPIASVNYSAMEDVTTKLDGYKVPYSLYEEIETGCYRAVPDNEETIKIFEDFFSMPTTIRNLKGAETRENYIKNYSQEKTIARWKQVIESLPPKSHILKTHEPAQPKEIGSNSDFVKWVITEVLGEPDRLGSYFELKMLRDLNYGSTTSIPGTYLNEDSHAFAGGERRPYGRKEAYEFCYNMRLRNNSIIKNIQEI